MRPDRVVYDYKGYEVMTMGYYIVPKGQLQRCRITTQ